MEVRTQVEAILREKKLSVRALSRMSGVRRQSIAAFLSGANLHLDNLAKLLAALGCDLGVVPSGGPKGSSPLANLSVDRRRLAALCRRRGVVKLALFGSAIRLDFGPESDIDVMVEFKRPPSFFELAEFEGELKGILSGSHPIDLVTPGSLSKHFRDEALKGCEVLYEKAA